MSATPFPTALMKAANATITATDFESYQTLQIAREYAHPVIHGDLSEEARDQFRSWAEKKRWSNGEAFNRSGGWRVGCQRCHTNNTPCQFTRASASCEACTEIKRKCSRVTSLREWNIRTEMIKSTNFAAYGGDQRIADFIEDMHARDHLQAAQSPEATERGQYAERSKNIPTENRDPGAQTASSSAVKATDEDVLMESDAAGSPQLPDSDPRFGALPQDYGAEMVIYVRTQYPGLCHDADGNPRSQEAILEDLSVPHLLGKLERLRTDLVEQRLDTIQQAYEFAKSMDATESQLQRLALQGAAFEDESLRMREMIAHSLARGPEGDTNDAREPQSEATTQTTEDLKAKHSDELRRERQASREVIMGAAIMLSAFSKSLRETVAQMGQIEGQAQVLDSLKDLAQRASDYQILLSSEGQVRGGYI
ncbi:hypothetical protein PLICRDRAFT_527762 [Plicaturopsis crispa FD-325 SS-3]|uniref:Zn(2)-C6 fungal-type domain-containing protein n=1 Tax=Plicaturopsis crispa FD-325 SS-3 TaxID=944288 RepID=A0A0C9SK06_PLICR|nr:hypothetical protein PLICRDRAFT_527762 [Plicaturopsis crispa FD-325 SS-3]